MAALGVLGQQNFTYDSFAFVVTKVKVGSSSDTVTVPVGTQSAVALTSSGTLSVSISAASTGDTLTISGGDASTGEVYVVSRHTGSAAGMGSA